MDRPDVGVLRRDTAKEVAKRIARDKVREMVKVVPSAQVMAIARLARKVAITVAAARGHAAAAEAGPVPPVLRING